MDLHRRMGHAPEQTMCNAVEGDNIAWLNTGVTVDEIHHVFSKKPCLTCVLSKRRDAGTQKWKKKHRIPIDIDEPDSDSSKLGLKPMVDGSRIWGIGECSSVENVGAKVQCMVSKMIFVYLTTRTAICTRSMK